jgi:phospholipase D1/2
MYDRAKVPRMPWRVSRYDVFVLLNDTSRHDVGLQVVGQPARDLARHFVQRLVQMTISLSVLTNQLSGGISC